MKTVSILAAAAVLVEGAPLFAQPVSMSWSVVGNAGNAVDPGTSFGSLRFGAVGYEYRIGTYEVTNAQYAAFLNAVAATDPNGLYNTFMSADSRGGITRSGSAGSYTYAVKANMGNKPVNYVSWYDAARMSNWMSNGQGSGGTESGVYNFSGPTTLLSITRDLSNPRQVFLPTEDEWYKAAYHQPASQGGDADGYWAYATQTNFGGINLAAATSTGDVANPGQFTANFGFGADWNGLNGNVTTVGSAGSLTYYGLLDMNGNVEEWMQTGDNAFNRTTRGERWNGNGNGLGSGSRGFMGSGSETDSLGFRLASPIPAPASAGLLALAGLVAARRRR